MSAIDKLLAEMQAESTATRQPSHTLTVMLTAATHHQLVQLSEFLHVPKTNLASRLLTAAIADAAAKVGPPPGDLGDASAPPPFIKRLQSPDKR